MLEKLKVTGLEEAADNVRRKVRRAGDLSGAADALDKALSEHHRERFEQEPVGDMNTLGPSVQNPQHPKHVFRLTPGGQLTFGTSVVYARAWENDTGRTLVVVPDKLVGEVLVEYIERGRS